MTNYTGDNAEYYYKQGLRLVCAGQLHDAVDFFTKAIEINPKFSEAYLNRGQIFLDIDRIIEGNTDIQKAKDLRSGKFRGKINGKSRCIKSEKPIKVNWEEIDNIYEALFPINSQDHEQDALDFDESFAYTVFSDDAINTEEAGAGLFRPTSEIHCYPAILELVNGKRLEVSRVRLLEPTNNDISIIRRDGHVERVIPLEHIKCISMTKIPSKLNKRKNSSCHVEIIETVDNNIYHVAVHPEQDNENVLFGFSAKEHSHTYKFIPIVNIRKRCQNRYLGEILLEKRFISNDILKRALKEQQQAKSMKIGKIIAQKAKVIYSAIEEELERVKRDKVNGRLKTGEILRSSGLVDEELVMEALLHQEYLKNMKIGQFLIEMGVVQEKEVYLALAEQFRLPFADLGKQKVSRKTLTLLSYNFFKQNEIIPISLVNDILTVATLQPDVTCLREKIIKLCKCKDVRFVLARPTHLRNIIALLDKMIWYVSDNDNCSAQYM